MKDNVYTIEFWEWFKKELKANKDLKEVKDIYRGYVHGLWKANRITEQKRIEMVNTLWTAVDYEELRKKNFNTEVKNEEFEEMCKKAGVKKEALCDTVFTRQFKADTCDLGKRYGKLEKFTEVRVEMTKEAIVTRLEYILEIAKTSGNCPILKNQLQYLFNKLEKEGDIKG